MWKYKNYSVAIIALIVMLLGGCNGTNNTESSDGGNPSSDIAFMEEKNEWLQYLRAIRGKKIIGGIHNREPNSEPAMWTNEIYKLTGEYPALWSGDFLFQEENIEHRGTMIKEAISQYHKGAIINIMWHACNPAYGQPCEWEDGKGVLSQLTDDQWDDLFIEGTQINLRFVEMLEEIVGYMKILKEKKVIVLFRPFHEMNQGRFWWGGRPGEEGTVKLYKMVYDYMVKQKNLNNIIWVWNIQDFPNLDTDVDLYNPGDEYWDIVSLDVYDDSTGYSQEKYESIRRVANGKPMGIGECQKLPSLEVLEKQKDWVFFMGWAELVFKHNKEETIKQIYSSDKVLSIRHKNKTKEDVKDF